MRKIVEEYCEFPTLVRRPMWQIWHKLMIRYDKDVTANFMNYGFQGLNGEKHLELHQEDENDRYCIQLYDHVVNKTDLQNKQVLEVGSGRGGGASYIARYYRPKTYTGLDISSSIIDFCNTYYNVNGLTFVKGRAEKQPFQNSSFDIVVNVESARCYTSLISFFNEVRRVLRPEGYFLFADMIKNHEIQDIRDKLKQCGFEIINEANITKNVVEALDRDTHRREKLINKKVPGYLRSSFNQFAGIKGTERYKSFANGKFEYWSYILRRE